MYADKQFEDVGEAKFSDDFSDPPQGFHLQTPPTPPDPVRQTYAVEQGAGMNLVNPDPPKGKEAVKKTDETAPTSPLSPTEETRATLEGKAEPLLPSYLDFASWLTRSSPHQNRAKK